MWWLLLIPVGIFVTTATWRAVIRFAVAHSSSWWSDPLALTFSLCFGIPGIFASIFGPFLLAGGTQ